ncbi:MAG: NAD(P)-dependent oxidoreductase [Pseudomonadota bacterium]
MKIGIIGASGTLGRAAVASLLKSGAACSINALIRRPDRALDEIAGCSTIPGGIFDVPALERLVRDSDVVVNLAARNPEGQHKDLQSVADFLELNGLGAALVAEVTRREQKPLIHFSTVAVYESGAYEEARLLAEDEPLPAMSSAIDGYFTAAVSAYVDRAKRLCGGVAAAAEKPMPARFPGAAPVYGLSKLIGECCVRAISTDACCIRMCDVYGPGHESRGVVTDHLGALREQGRIAVDFDFRSTVSFIYIEDVIAFIALLASAMTGKRVATTLVNLAGQAIDEAGFAELLKTLVDPGEGDARIAVSAPVGTRYDRRYSTGVLQREFAEFSLTPLADGLRKTWSLSS